ncbi:hypothetical protein STEG23_002731 [Scotinomys teguina]
MSRKLPELAMRPVRSREWIETIPVLSQSLQKILDLLCLWKKSEEESQRNGFLSPNLLLQSRTSRSYLFQETSLRLQ